MCPVVGPDRFWEICEEIVGTIPERFLRGLNGGIVVSEDRAPEDGPPGTVRLGEYVVSGTLGRFIVLYYRSFMRLYGGATEATLRRQIRNTLQHEILHHVETLAGVDYLARDDARKLARWWERSEDS